MNIDVKIRYNTVCDDDKLYWRILIDGVEHLCSHININNPVQTTKDVVYDPKRGFEVDKHHISCKASSVIFDGDIVNIH